jgi:hypothetical protein
MPVSVSPFTKQHMGEEESPIKLNLIPAYNPESMLKNAISGK